MLFRALLSSMMKIKQPNNQKKKKSEKIKQNNVKHYQMYLVQSKLWLCCSSKAINPKFQFQKLC